MKLRCAGCAEKFCGDDCDCKCHEISDWERIK